MPIDPVCFFGTLEEAQAYADSVGGNIIDGPWDTETECNVWCESVSGTGTVSTTHCGSKCDPLSEEMFVSIEAMLPGSPTECDGFSSGHNHLRQVVPLLEDSCEWQGLNTISLGGVTYRLALLYVNDIGNEYWILGVRDVDNPNSLEPLYYSTDDDWVCNGQSSMNFIGYYSLCNWPNTVRVFRGTI